MTTLREVNVLIWENQLVAALATSLPMVAVRFSLSISASPIPNFECCTTNRLKRIASAWRPLQPS
jgi:hypothetical protein